MNTIVTKENAKELRLQAMEEVKQIVRYKEGKDQWISYYRMGRMAA